VNRGPLKVVIYETTYILVQEDVRMQYEYISYSLTNRSLSYLNT